MLCWCAPPAHCGACCVGVWPLPRWVLCSRAAHHIVVRAALLRGPPRGGACSAGAWPPSWWGTLCWCLSAAVVVRGVVVLGLGCRRVCRLGAGVGLGFVVLVVVFELVPCAACFVCSVLSPPPYCRRVWMGVVSGWIAVVVVLITWPGRVLCWCAAPLMVGRTVLVRAPPHGGVCCVGVWPPPWWGVLRWFVVPILVGRAVLVRAPLMVGRAVSVCAPPPWWGVLRWFVAPLVVGRAVSVPARRGRGVWFEVWSSVRGVVVAVVLLAWPGLVLCWCVFPPLLGRAVFVRGPPLGGECCVGVFGFRFVVL